MMMKIYVDPETGMIEALAGESPGLEKIMRGLLRGRLEDVRRRPELVDRFGGGLWLTSGMFCQLQKKPRPAVTVAAEGGVA